MLRQMRSTARIKVDTHLKWSADRHKLHQEQITVDKNSTAKMCEIGQPEWEDLSAGLCNTNIFNA